MSDEFILTYLCSALGSGIGIVLSIITYSKVHQLLSKKTNKNQVISTLFIKGNENG